MSQKAQFLYQIIESVGGPLLSALLTPSGQDKDKDKEQAEKMAALLGKAVQGSIDIAALLQDQDENLDDSLRVAALGLASELMSRHYKEAGSVPDEDSLSQYKASLKTALALSENFAPSPESTARLKNLENDARPVDNAQNAALTIKACLPVIEAVHTFSFGQQTQKLLSVIGNHLSTDAAKLREAIAPDLDTEEQKRVELSLLGTLGEIYAVCHGEETKRLMAMSEDERAKHPQDDGGGISMQGVWEEYGKRVEMLESLSLNLLPGGSQTDPQTKEGSGEAQAPSAPKQEAAPSAPPAELGAVQSAEPAAAKNENPMSVFSKKPAEPPEGQSPAEEKAPPEPQQPEAPPPAEQAPSDSGEDESGGDNPMSFFKKGS